MAKNWKVGEAVKAIQAGNKEDILDIGRRFPLFANLAAQVNEAGVTLLDCVPDYCSARKIESVLKGDVQEAADNDDDGAEDEAPAKKAPAKAEKAEKKAPAKKAAKKEEEEEEDDDSLESKSAKELYEMCKEAGLKVKPKQDKSVYIEALNAVEEEAEDEGDWDEEEEEPAPKKAPAKKEAKQAPKKAAKKDDEDEDWDI